ncbi:MAG TPA: BREX system P-loop protein BrxC, partial [Agitococcus sp.]|nr:BREX system P-loop protein BrxC [Agitococcus sp.]
QHLGDAFAVKVLKTLFLVKYVKDFKSTLRNLSVLMLEEFNQDIASHRQRLEHALNLLEQQTYIQRHGEFYEYLTDTEKDVETEIKNTDVDINDVVNELQKIVFDQIIKQTKIRYSNQQDYNFTRKMDDRLYSREYELAIHIISPFNENAANNTNLRMQSMGRDELRVIMPADARLMNDLLMYKRTEKYVRQNTSLVQKDGIQQILGSKALQNQERLAEISQRIQRLVGESSLIINGGDIDISSTDGQSRIISGFHQLIEYTYTNLSMLRSINYSENDIGKYLNKAKDGLLANDVAPLTEAEQEILAFIKANQRNGGRTTIKAVIDKFERKNYGWYYAAILCNLALLASRGKIELRSDGNLLEDAAIERALRNTQSQNNVIIDPQIEFSPSQIRALKEFYNEFFDKPAPASEAKLLAKETAEAFKSLFIDLDKLHSQKAHYPFLATLSAVLEKIKPISQQQSAWFFTELVKQAEALFELKENMTAPVLSFMNGAAKSLYDQANAFLSQQNANLNALDATEIQAIKLALADTLIYQGNKIQRISQQLDGLKTKLKQLHTQELEQAVAKIEQLRQKLRQSPEFALLNNAQQQELMQTFEQSIAQLGQQQLIAVIRDNCRSFEEKTFIQLSDKLHDWLQPKPMPVEPITDKKEVQSSVDNKVAEKKPEYIKPSIASRDIKVNFAKPWLLNESDVDDYLKAMRDALLNEINTGKRINL